MPKLRFLHPLALLVGCIFLAAALSYVLPAGQYERREDPQTGRNIVVANSYHSVAPDPVNLWEALLAIPEGMAEASAVVFFVFLSGSAFTVVDETGALQRSVDWLIRKFQRQDQLVIPLASILFALGGVLTNMQEEFLALVPVLLLLTHRLGYDPLTAVAMSAGSAAVGSSFSPINPFQVGIAQKLAEIPLLSGSLFRIIFLILALLIWIGGTMYYAHKTRVLAQKEQTYEISTLSRRHGIIMLLLFATFTFFVVGILNYEWGFEQIAVLFFVMGVLAGLIGGLGITGTSQAFVKGFEAMAFSALLIGFARAIFVVLDKGQIIDTIVNGLFTPLAELPVALSAVGMMAVQTLIHFPVPSVSGQAVLTLPVLIPLSDLLGMSRQVTVLTYQYGAGLCELLTPTNGALMAMLAAAGVGYDKWLRFAFPLFLALFILGILAVGIGIVTGL